MRSLCAMALMAAGCGVQTVDSCAGVAGACLDLQLRSAPKLSVDALDIHLVAGTIDATQRTSTAESWELPVAVSVRLSVTQETPVQVEVAGWLRDQLQGVGQAGDTISPGEHRTLTVSLLPQVPGGDDLSLADLAHADLAGSQADGFDAGEVKANGEPCDDKSECESGECADGVCCDTACNVACRACNINGSVGTCAPSAGQMTSPQGHPACGTESPTSCGLDGTCDGTGQCHLYDSDTVCMAASCDPGTASAVGESHCDGVGHCVTPSPIPCDPYVCNATNTACYPSCTSTAECLSPHGCSNPGPNGSCGLKRNGTPCGASGGDSECASNACSDGVCCDVACTGCKSCNQPTALGTCTPVPAGSDPHGTCSGVLCAAGCNGLGTGCAPAAATTQCSFTCANYQLPATTMYPCTAAQCGQAVVTTRKCDGVTTGACSGATATSACANSLICASGSTCIASTCTYDADCVSGKYCKAGTCTNRVAYNGTCSVSRECQLGLVCHTSVAKCKSCEYAYDCGNSVATCNVGDCTSCSTGPQCVSAGTGTSCNGGFCQCSTNADCVNPGLPFCDGGVCKCGGSTGNNGGGDAFHVCNTTTNAAGALWLRVAGELCLFGTECVSGTCTNRTCGKAAAGTPCRSAANCLSNTCAADCANNHCVPVCG
jgi:hypothetical protein